MISLSEGHKLLVADCDNHRLQLASHLDKRNRYYQTMGAFGVAPSNGLQRPTGLAVSASGDALYLSDSHNHRIQHRSWPEFKVLRTAGSYGAEAGQFNFPSAIALAEGRLYVADTRNHRIVAYRRGTLRDTFCPHRPPQRLCGPRRTAREGPDLCASLSPAALEQRTQSHDTQTARS